MKTTLKTLGLVAVIIAVAVPAGYAAFEAGTAAPGSKTLADFQRDFSGTKPVVAWNQYQDSLKGNVPRPTLGVSSIRLSPEEMTIADYAEGTKPVAGFNRYWEAQREKDLSRPAGTVIKSASSGTKPVIGFLKG